MSRVRVKTWVYLSIPILAVSGCATSNEPGGDESRAGAGDVPAATSTTIPAVPAAVPVYTTTAPAAGMMLPGAVIRSYRDNIPWFGENRDHVTLLALGLTLGLDYFLHPLLDLQESIPAGTAVVLIPSNGVGDATSATRQNNATAQQNLDAFVRSGGVLIVDMGDNLEGGGYLAPGATGTPDLIFPTGPDNTCRDATLTAAALGADGIPGTADDHPLVKGPDGIAGTADDLNNDNIDLATSCYVAHGHLAQGITLPAGATVLMTARFDGVEKPILAEYCLDDGVVIVDTISKEFSAHQGPSGHGSDRPTFFMRNLFDYALGSNAGASCNAAPGADAGADISVECADPDGAEVTLDGTDSMDPDGDPLSYWWAAPGITFDDPGSATPTAMFPPGTTTATLTVTDPAGLADSDSMDVSVVDTTAPSIILTLLLTELWPPDHTWHLVAGQVGATDTCDSYTVTSIQVTSNEPVNAPGDGDTAPDWMVTQNADGTFDIWLRAERSGHGQDRVYTILVRAVDAAGNTATASAQVMVAHVRD